MVVAGLSCNWKWRKMLKSTPSTVKRKFYIQYLQKKFHFFALVTFKERNFIKTNQLAILRKIYHSIKMKIGTSIEYLCNIFLQSPLMFHLWTIVLLIYWKELFLRANPPKFMNSGKLWKKNRNQYLWKF